MTPLQRYQQVLDSGDLSPDAEQARVVAQLDAIHQALLQTPMNIAPSGGFFQKITSKIFAPKPVEKIRGLYLWGGVGRGKTLLTDMFFETVPDQYKTRLHFHRFMKLIHDELRPLKHVEDPLVAIAENWSQKTRLLVLDEMHVNDITDAMLLGGLLTELFKRGLTLVTTSNVTPDDLYKDGLQRDRFIPAIEQIKAHTTVYEMQGETDYRLRALQSADTYLLTTDVSAEAKLKSFFDQLNAAGAAVNTKPLKINRRALDVVQSGEGVAWFTFDSLCNTPRSTLDYIEMATVFHSVLISGIPVLNDSRNDEARRLVNLIDELYDRGVNLIVSAEAEPESLYRGKRLEFEFVRAASRLREMQTVEYLARPHHVTASE